MGDHWEGNEYLDNETGEKNKREILIQKLSTDAETGEPEIEGRGIWKKTFQVPHGYLQQHHHQEKTRKKSKPRGKPTYGFYWRKQEIRSNVVKEFVICKRQNVCPFVLVIPTLFIGAAWASLLCLLGEACLHIWSHKRTWKTSNGNIEYRSPFHLISSHFCVHCRSQKWMEKISQIQDKRNLRRRILYPNFRRK